MPHLLIEVARDVLERKMLSMPIELDASGAPADILAPPLEFQQSVFSPFGTVRVQIIVRTVKLQPVVGSAQAIMAMTFDDSSVEVLPVGQAVGLLSGTMSGSALVALRKGLAADGGANATFGIDLSQSIVHFQFDAASRGRLAGKMGPLDVTSIENAVSAQFTDRFRRLGFQAVDLTLILTPGVASEDVLTVEALPTVVWVDAQTLALALRYAPESTPPPFQPVPFLTGGSDFGMRLSNDGFQRTVRNPAVRKLAREMLAERRIDDFVHDAFVARGGTGEITDADRADGAARLNAYLQTAGGQGELANETPGPVGGGALRKRIHNVPDPFSDFDVEVPELDLWLGDGRVEGRVVARGSVNGFGFSAETRFRATPVLVPGDRLSIELHDLEIDRPDIDIDLPAWLEWAAGILVGVIAGPLVGVLVGFLLSAVVSALVEAFIPSNLGNKVDAPEGKSLGKLPKGVSIRKLQVTPEFLAFIGGWFVGIDDPRPFYPRATIVDTVDRTPSGPSGKGSESFICASLFGNVMNAREGTGTRFTFVRQSWTSTARVALKTSAIPLPLTRFPWKIAVGYRTKEQYPAMSDPPMILVPGAMAVTATVWHPEPPFLGHTERRSFTLNVTAVGDDGFAIDVPATAGCITLELSTHVIDALGDSWEDLHYVDVPNESVSFGDDFKDFAAKCRNSQREIHIEGAPSLLDERWNPPNILVERLHEAIRTEQPAVSRVVGAVVQSHGVAGLQMLLAPSLAGKILRRSPG